MSSTKLITASIATILIAVAVHFAAIHYFPKAKMTAILDFFTSLQKGQGVRMIHAPAVTARSRRVVRPSPDLAYSNCAFDLSKGPVDIHVPAPAGYFSIALYADNTDNFFVLNDRDMAGKPAHVRVVRAGDGEQLPDDAVIALAPSDRVALLIRRQADKKSDWPVIRRERAQMLCSQVQS